MLLQVAEQVLTQRLKPDLLSYCPTMDLVAVATVDQQVQVYRLNGQKVFAVSRLDKAAVTAMCWKPNGRALIIAYDHGVLSLVSTYTGKVINQISSEAFSNTPICYLGWGVTFTDTSAAKSLLESGKTAKGAGVAAKKAMQEGGLLDDALAKGLRSLEIEFPLDLPAELRNLEVEASLPKLSVLPSSGPDDEAFSTRSSIDTIFHTSRKESNDAADVILMSFEDGTIHLNIYDFFELGIFHQLKMDKIGRVVRHCSSPYSSTHGLLLADNTKPGALAFIAMDLKLIPDNGTYLSLLASKSGQIQNLVRYIRAAILQIGADFRMSQDLPRRFMNNAEEDLQEKEQTDFVSAIFHFVATGHCSPVLKEWLIDQLGERGHKRWEKAAVSGYEGICRYTLQNLIPAIDRFILLVGRLRGLSRFFESSTSLGLSTTDLNLLLDTADCLQFLAHTVLRVASTELRGVTVFSQWLRLEIDVQNTEPTSAATEDFPARYAPLDYAELLEYIQGGMQQSQLVHLCASSGDATSHAGAAFMAQHGPLYRDFKKLVMGRAKDKVPPCLEDVLARLDKQCHALFSNVAEALRRKVRFGDAVPVLSGDADLFDVAMVVDKTPVRTDACTAIVAVSSKSKPLITIKKIGHTLVNGISSVQNMHATHVSLPADRAVCGLRFVNDTTLVLALKGSRENSPCIVYLPVHDHTDPANALSYAKVPLSSASATSGPELSLSTEASLQSRVVHVFDEDPAWTPVQVEVNGRHKRRALCLVAADRLRYRVFDLDATSDADEDVGEDDEMEMERSAADTLP